MNLKRLLPYIIGLIILAFSLGSLPRGSPNGSLLFQSTWLLYLIYLGPIIALGIMVALIVVIASYWRDIGAAIGSNMAQNRLRKRRSRYALFVQIFMWGLAAAVLIEKQGTILNSQANPTSGVVADITGSGGPPPNPLPGFIRPVLSTLVQNTWFSLAFLGLVIVGGLVLAQSVRASLKETSELSILELQARRTEGLQATQEAIRLIDDVSLDPRTRIIGCYKSMIMAVTRVGVLVSPDQTARELDNAIRTTFALKGPATSELTKLFEEARYSIHEINDQDASQAREYLESIVEELKIQLDS